MTFLKTCQVSYAGIGDFRGTSPNSNLTGLICVYADWIVWIHVELGMQDYYEDLSGFIRGYGRLLRYVTEFKPDRSHMSLWWLSRLNTYRTRNARLLRRPVRFHKRVWETFAVCRRVQTWQVLSVPMLIESFQYIKNSERMTFTVRHRVQTWQVSFTSVLSE
jgi:hypothetical protein